MKNKSILFIGLLGLALAVFYQELDQNLLNGEFPSTNGMITSADEASYFSPPINFFETGIWKDNSIGPSSYSQRPPGYGSMVLLSYMISQEHYYTVMKILQIIAFFASIFLVARISTILGATPKWTLITTSLYALLPVYSSMMYFTITESISPLFLIWSTYEWLMYLKTDRRPLRFITISAFTLLVRPQFLLFILFYAAFAVIQKRKKWRYLPLIFIPLCIWLIRTYSYTGTFSLHPIYSAKNETIYRPAHKEMTELYKNWEYRSDVFHQSIAQLETDSSEAVLNQVAAEIPKEIRSEVKPVLRSYQLHLHNQKALLASGKLEELNEREVELSKEIKKITNQVARENPMTAFLLTPIKSAKELLLNSHLHQQIFQRFYRGNVLVEILRYLSLGIVLLSLAIAMARSGVRYADPAIWIMGLSITVSFIYLIYVQRLNEDRYLYPMLPIALIIAMNEIRRILDTKFKSR